jgi:hypothetical protein
MQIRSLSAYQKQSSPDPATVDEDPSPGLLADPFSDQQRTQTTHHGVGAELDFPCCYFKRWFVENKMLNVWVDMRETKCEYLWQFPDQDSLCLQVSSVRCSWWSLGKAWWSLAGPWNSPVQPLDSPSVITGCTRSARLQGRDWSGSHTLGMMVVAQSTKTPWKADSPSPESIPRIHCICKWTAWELMTPPRITVQDTQCVNFSVSQTQTSLQGRSQPAGGAQDTLSFRSAMCRCRGS